MLFFSAAGSYTRLIQQQLILKMEDTFSISQPLTVMSNPKKTKKKEKRVSIEVDNVGDLVELDLGMLKIARKKSVGKEMMESSLKIPKSLRSVAPFLEEAQCLVRYGH